MYNFSPRLIGHLDVQQSLQTLVKAGHLPHAFLFHGPKGVGKRTAAELLAARVLCGAHPQTAEAELSYNPASPFVPQLKAGSHPNFLVLSPAEGKQSISVEQVREQIDGLGLSGDGQRFVVIDDADSLTTAAANALLKTLEEPGRNIYIILLSHNISKLLPTVVSRCRRYRFAPLSAPQALQVIHTVCPDTQNNIGAAAEKALEVYPGMPGQALALAATGMETVTLMEQLLKTNPITPVLVADCCEVLAQKKLVPVALDYLLAYIAAQARSGSSTSYLFGELYQRVHQKMLESAEFNISADVTLETCLFDVVSCSHLHA